MSFQRKFQAIGFHGDRRSNLVDDLDLDLIPVTLGRDELFADSWPMVILITGNQMFIRTCTECPYVHLWLCHTSRVSSDYGYLSISLIENTSSRDCSRDQCGMRHYL